MATYNGKKGNDVIVGSKRDDFINGREGNDTLSGGDGNDSIYGGIGNDQLYGNAGNDRLIGEAGDDVLNGGGGNDIMNGGDGIDALDGGNGGDTLNGGSGDDGISGGAGHDEIFGESGIDTMAGGADDDIFIFFGQSESGGTGDIITDHQPGVDAIYCGLYDNLWDANSSVAGQQLWDFVGSAPGAAPSNGNGQATVSSEGFYTVLRLYNNDGDSNADFTLRFQGAYNAEDLQITLYSGNFWNLPGIIFP